MVKLSVAIMAHKKRAGMVDELVSQLDRDVTVVWDTVNDRHDTGARAMEAFDPSCTHHLVLQDDVVPCRDLIAGIEQALAHVPDGCPVSFYTGNVRPFRKEIDAAVRQARAQSVAWIVMQGIYWGPAVCLPTAHIEPMLRWFRGPGANVTNYDRRMSVWYSLRETDVWYSRPSLVDHRGDESLCGHGSGRHAHEFLGLESSALDVNWESGHLVLERTDRMDDARQQAAALAGVK